MLLGQVSAMDCLIPPSAETPIIPPHNLRSGSGSATYAVDVPLASGGNWTEVPHALSWGHPLQIWQQRHECAPSTSTARRRWCGGAASCELHPGSWSNTLTPECAHVADTLVRLQTVGGPPHTGLLTLKSSACQRPLALCICVQGAASCV